MTELTLWHIVGLIFAAASGPTGVLILFIRQVVRGQTEIKRDLTARMDRAEKQLHQLPRDYTTKEEWLREVMLSREQLGRLLESTARIEAELATTRCVAADLSPAVRAMTETAEKLRQSRDASDG